MSWATNRIFLSKCEEVIAFDSTLPNNGAPGLPGEVRTCEAELADGSKVLQRRKLCLIDLAAGTVVAKGKVLSLKSGSYYIADALAAADTPAHKCAGFVSEKINENKIADQAQGELPGGGSGYWAWLVVGGPVDALSDAAVAANAEIVVKAASGAGQLDDTAVSTVALSRAVVGVSLAAAAGADTSFLCRATLVP